MQKRHRFVKNNDRISKVIKRCGSVTLAILGLAAFKAAHKKYKNAHYDLESDLEPDDWREYPRPQLKRSSYISLNGKWKLNGKDILVPFPPQAVLSGYKGRVGSVLVYEKKFTNRFERKKDILTKDGSADEKKHVILHFGAVDQVADVYLNDNFICHHEGGYLPFEADITKELKSGENQLIVKVKDTLSSKYPYGKQCKNRGGMWYTPVSGIWQSVWLEQTGSDYITDIKITPYADDKVEIQIMKNPEILPDSDEKCSISYDMEINLEGFKYRLSSESGQFIIDMANIKKQDGSWYYARHWTPDDPWLYDFKVLLRKDGKVTDRIKSYFALRTVDIRLVDGIKRICLNGKPVFLHGVLDQGYFSDGLFLPANSGGYEKDILRMKSLGFNTLRKHIKIESEEFYYACDRLGILVIQDMVNSGRYSFIRDTVLPNFVSKRRKDIKKFNNTSRKKFFIKHCEDTINHLYNHPSIIGYTLFNEGWGQFNSDELGKHLREFDGTRIMDYTSGWFTQSGSDVESVHVYYNNIQLARSRKPMIVSECGGYSYAVKKHCYSRFRKYGYGDCKSLDDLTQKIKTMYDEMIIPAIPDGLCGSIYTQLSDVEDETNGIYTYDRKICKVDKETMLNLGSRLKITERQSEQ